MATWGVRSLLLLSVLLEDQRGSLRRNTVKLLLFGYKVYLRLWLHCLLVHLMLLLRSESTSDGRGLSSGVEREWIRAYRCHETESLVLVTSRHRRSSSDKRRRISMMVHLGRCVVWCVHGSRVYRVLTLHLVTHHHLLQAIILRTSPLSSLTFHHHLLLEL